MKYKTVTSPRYADAEQLSVLCTVVFVLQNELPETPAVPPVAEIPAVLPTFDDNGNMLTPGSPSVPEQPGRPAIPAVPEVLSEPWPFLATPTDGEAHGREIYAKARAGEFGTVAAYVAPPPPPPEPVIVPASITRRQCALQLLAEGLITEAEAVAMAATATPPAYVNTLFAGLSSMDRTRALIDFAANTYDRGNPLIAAMMTATGKTLADADAFFVAASQL